MKNPLCSSLKVGNFFSRLLKHTHTRGSNDYKALHYNLVYYKKKVCLPFSLLIVLKFVMKFLTQWKATKQLPVRLHVLYGAEIMLLTLCHANCTT